MKNVVYIGALTPKVKKEIDAMSRYEMCKLWRYSKVGASIFIGETGRYFKDRLFTHFGGFTPEISKHLNH